MPDRPTSPAAAALRQVAQAAEDGADVRALGVLLWTTLTGQAPAEGAVPQLAQHGSLSVAVNRILRTALAEEPSARYASAAAMRDDLLRAARLGDEPLVPAEPADEEPRGPVRSPLVVVVLAVLIVVVAVLGGLAAPHLLDDTPAPGSPATSTP